MSFIRNTTRLYILTLMLIPLFYQKGLAQDCLPSDCNEIVQEINDYLADMGSTNVFNPMCVDSIFYLEKAENTSSCEKIPLMEVDVEIRRIKESIGKSLAIAFMCFDEENCIHTTCGAYKNDDYAYIKIQDKDDGKELVDMFNDLKACLE